MAVSAEEQLACVEREVRMRHRVYPRWVEGGRMTPKKAAEEIAAMEAVRETIAAVARGERLI